MARRRYPSDHRPFFRVLDDVLDDAELNALPLADQAVFYRLLATLNRAESKDGYLNLPRASCNALAAREHHRHSVAALRRLAAATLCSVSTDGLHTVVFVPKWAEIQGFAPAELQPNSGRIPAKRGEEKRGEERRIRRVPKPRATLFPADGLTPEQKRSLAASPSLKDITPSQFVHALGIVADWSHSNSKKRADWVAVVRGAINRGWALEGYSGGSPGNGRGKAIGRGNSNYSPPRESSNWEDISKGPETLQNRTGATKGGSGSN